MQCSCLSISSLLRVGGFKCDKSHACFHTALQLRKLNFLNEMFRPWSDGNYCSFAIVTLYVWGKLKNIFRVEKVLK